MRRIILIIFASLMFCNIGYAEIRMIEKTRIDMENRNTDVSTFCVDGYKFILAQGERDKALSIDLKQIFELRDGKSLPAKC